MVGIVWPMKGSKGNEYSVELTDEGFECDCMGFGYHGYCKHSRRENTGASISKMQGFFTPKEQVDQTTRKELDRIASIDKQIDLMDRYPDAEAMIERLKKGYLE